MNHQKPIPLPQKRSADSGHVRSVGAGALVIAVVVGIQLGSIPWRYRRQIWKLQGFLLGGLVGYVVGRLNAAAPGGQAQSSGQSPRLPGR
jgi:hypothetical protein